MSPFETPLFGDVVSVAVVPAIAFFVTEKVDVPAGTVYVNVLPAPNDATGQEPLNGAPSPETLTVSPATSGPTPLVVRVTVVPCSAFFVTGGWNGVGV